MIDTYEAGDGTCPETSWSQGSGGVMTKGAGVMLHCGRASCPCLEGRRAPRSDVGFRTKKPELSWRQGTLSEELLQYSDTLVEDPS